MLHIIVGGVDTPRTYGDSAFHVDLPQRKGGGTKYNVTLDSFAIMGQPVKDSLITNSGMLLDTGTSNIVVPDSVRGLDISCSLVSLQASTDD